MTLRQVRVAFNTRRLTFRGLLDVIVKRRCFQSRWECTYSMGRRPSGDSLLQILETQMAAPAKPRQQVQFADLALDLRTGDLWRDGERLLLPHQSFQILAALLERPGELITREELVKSLWASDVFVDFEGSLNKAIKRLREVLHDSADQPRFIETLPAADIGSSQRFRGLEFSL